MSAVGLNEGSGADASYEDAFSWLHRLALTRARRVLGNADDAEEIAQETMLRAYTAWSSVFLYAEAWVTRVATNLAISKVRRGEPTAVAFAMESEAAVDERLDVSRAVSTLPLRQQQVMVLRHVADLSEGEVAEMLGISSGAVKRHLHRAMTALKEMRALAPTYQRRYDYKRKELEYRRWTARHTLPAPEPHGGWPPPPWDHSHIAISDGHVERLAVDADGNLILDADGDEVVTGVGFGFVLCKPLRPYGTLPHVMVPNEALAPEALDAVDRARELADLFGHVHVGTEHLGLALAERMDDPAPLEVRHLRRGVALFYDGPHADARLALVQRREKSGWTRPLREGMVPAVINVSLSNSLKFAAVQASRRGELATCRDLLDGVLKPGDLPVPPPPSFVFSAMELGRENRIPGAFGDDPFEPFPPQPPPSSDVPS